MKHKPRKQLCVIALVIALFHLATLQHSRRPLTILQHLPENMLLQEAEVGVDDDTVAEGGTTVAARMGEK